MRIKDRIRKHYNLGIKYHELMRLVFPPEEYPNAYGSSTNGGPPGCAMAFGRALREMKAFHDYNDHTIHLKRGNS